LRAPVKGSAYDRHHFEVLFSKASDPWQYGTPYEQTKYERTLSLVPPVPIERALELGCAEGHFTVQLAPRVGRLIAADISHVALERAAKRCVGLKNISFTRIDINQDSLPGPFDLIVCSEVLYYVSTIESLRATARKLARALKPGGYLLMAHANLVVDEPDRTGFDWDLPFGAKVIGEVFGRIRPLQLVEELQTPLYRIHLFKRDSRLRLFFGQSTLEVVEIKEATPLPTEAAAAQIQWDGGRPRRNRVVQTGCTERLPILMYHRVAEGGSPSTARYRVTPEIFEIHLRYLRDAGYNSVRLEDWWAAMEGRKPLPGRAVILTFDDGYLDFKEQAWPLLKHYGFSAIVFLVAGEIGQFNRWDRFYGEEIPLLSWEDIRELRDGGVEFGSHSTRHDPLGGLSIDEVVREAARSRLILQRGLGVPVDKFAYPYGDHNQAIQHLIGACGYVFGLSCRQDLSTFRDSALALPRIEVTGSDSLEQLVAKLTSSSADQPG
jgi:peptidoglycan/xylan/chitin deacetylase (PgdA/CDA1 family)/2-polyprenyl-3-methyl-5-hydroxy-6-metoxy-1,4-benzoquinol methylase